MTTKLTSPESLRVRPAVPADLEPILDLWWQLMAEHDERDPEYWGLIPKPEALAAVQDYLANAFEGPGHIILVAEIERRVVGFVHGRPLERPPIFRVPTVARVDEVAVDKNYRRRGVGKAMMQALLAALSAAGLTCVELMVDSQNPAAQALYASLHFIPRQLHLVWMDRGQKV